MKKYRFRLLISIIALLAGVAAVYFWYAISANEGKTSEFDRTKIWNELLTFENRDLNYVNRIKLFNDFFKLIDQRIFAGNGDPRLFTKLTNENNESYYVLVGVRLPRVSDEPTSLCFQTFDQNGNHLSSKAIDTSTHFNFTNIHLRFSSEFGRNVIETRSERTIWGQADEKLAYALEGNEIVLVGAQTSVRTEELEVVEK